GERVQVARPRVRRQRLPARQRLAGGLHRGVDVLGAGLRDAADDLAIAGRQRLERLPTLRFHPLAADEEAKAAPVALEPLLHRPGALGSGTVVEGGQDVGDAGHLAPWPPFWA